MMMNHVKQNEYANLLGAGPTSMEAEANKWILNKKTAQVIQLLLISPPPPLGLGVSVPVTDLAGTDLAPFGSGGAMKHKV